MCMRNNGVSFLGRVKKVVDVFGMVLFVAELVFQIELLETVPEKQDKQIRRA